MSDTSPATATPSDLSQTEPPSSLSSSLSLGAPSLPSFAGLGWGRRGLRLAIGAVVALYLIYSSFGIAGPFLWGHYGYHAASYAMRARMTLRYGLVVPATAAGFDGAPGREAYYLHHPIGYHHLLVPFFKVLGEAEWVVRLVPVLGGLLLLWTLYRLVRRFWSDTTAVLAMLLYITLPFMCSFSVLVDPMFLEMASCLLALEAFVAFQSQPSGRRRELLRACIALALGGLLMWEVYFLAFFMGLYVIGWWLYERFQKHIQRRTVTSDGGFLSPPLRWLFATFVATVLPFGFHFLFTWRVGMFDETMGSYRERSTASYSWVYAQISKWLTLLYGKPLLAVGLLWLVMFLVRLLSGEARRRDQAIVVFFVLNTLYILAFAKGAAIHLYRVYFYSSFLALATVDLLCELYTAVAAWARSRGRSEVTAARWAAIALGMGLAAYFGAQGPHALSNLTESREVMGTHGHSPYDPDYAKQRFAMELAQAMERNDYLLSYNMNKRLEFSFYADRRESAISSVAALPGQQRLHPRSWFITDVRLGPLESRMLHELLRQHSATLYYPYVMIDLRPTAAAGTAGQSAVRREFNELRFAPGPMTPTWRWFYSHKYPPLRPVPHASSYGQCVVANLDPAGSGSVVSETQRHLAISEPPLTPRTPTADLVCYHNYLVAIGRSDEAAQFRGRLQALFTPVVGGTLPKPWAGRGQLLGVRLRAQPTRPPEAELYLLSDGSSAEGSHFQVQPSGGTQSSAGVTGEIFSPTSSGSAARPWLWWPRAGYLLVDDVPLGRGRQRILLQRGPMAPAAGASTTPAFDVGEVEVP
ncbi:MAG TPA: glycosyltransferase family 39 protein [Pseudomonadota bacterium]|nr:glycosyltransferase family 39 protein [Pseudomonadota bacterium]